jgi:hypothetical protein
MAHLNLGSIKKEAEKYSDRSQLRSNHRYDKKSVYDGFIEGYKQCIKDIKQNEAVIYTLPRKEK